MTIKPGTHNKNIIDIDACLKLTFNDHTVVKALLSLLCDTIIEFINEIQNAYNDNDAIALKHVVHKLKGGFYYCSTPNLKECAEILEDKSNAKIKNLQPYIDDLRMASKEFLAEYQRLVNLNEI